MSKSWDTLNDTMGAPVTRTHEYISDARVHRFAARLELGDAAIDSGSELRDLFAELLQHAAGVGVRFAADIRGLLQGAILNVRRTHLGRAHQVVLTKAF